MRSEAGDTPTRLRPRRLSLSCACEIDGKPFDAEVSSGTRSTALADALLNSPSCRCPYPVGATAGM